MGIIETARMFDIEEGIQIGKEQGIRIGRKEIRLEQQEQFVKNLITQLGLSNEQVSKAANVPLSAVKKIRSQLEKNNI